ncbi:sulfur carrier protein ThiS [Candidatus Nitrospira bockiana]
MRIYVNGEPQTTGCDTSIAELLHRLEIRPERVAVEVNLQIVDKKDFSTRMLKDGDRVEIISFIGGGSS